MASCPVNSTLGVCDVLSETGNGIGVMVDALRTPVGQFILFLSIIGAVVALILGIVYAIRRVTTKNLFPSLYLALALGVLFALEAVIINFVKYESIDFSANLGQDPFLIALGLSFATAVSEEIAFRGYLFNRVWRVLGDEWRANLITSTIWALIHVPIAIFWWELNPTNTVLYLFLTTLFGIGSAWVFARTKNVASSILLHVLWEWPIILFR